MILYDRRVTGVGALLGEFLQAGVLVFFGDDAPEELAEFSVTHTGDALREPIAAGDVIMLGDTRLTVLAVGDVANANLANLGHLVLKANGQNTIELPGDVNVAEQALPEITIGMPIRIERILQKNNHVTS